MSKELKISCIPYRGWSCKYSELNQLTNEEQSLMWQAFNKYKIGIPIEQHIALQNDEYEIIIYRQKIKTYRIFFTKLNHDE